MVEKMIPSPFSVLTHRFTLPYMDTRKVVYASYLITANKGNGLIKILFRAFRPETDNIK